MREGSVSGALTRIMATVHMRCSVLSAVPKLCSVCHTATPTVLVTWDRGGGEAAGRQPGEALDLTALTLISLLLLSVKLTH